MRNEIIRLKLSSCGTSEMKKKLKKKKKKKLNIIEKNINCQLCNKNKLKKRAKLVLLIYQLYLIILFNSIF